jgi:sirohydrochlorin ferrochelatase
VNQTSSPLKVMENSGSSSDSPPWGVILLCHGSQRGTSRQECSCSWRPPAVPLSSTDNEEGWPGWCRNCPSTPQGLNDAATRLQVELGQPQAQVLLSCLEFIQPHPGQAVQLLVNQGLERVVVVPYLLGHGKHATLELDEVLDELRAEIPQVHLYLADGLGADSRIAELVVERIRDLDGSGPAPSTTGHPIGVLLVKAGTKTQYDDCLWLEELGQMAEKGLGLGYAVAVAQSHYGDPTMESAAARLVEERRVSSIICVPYLFFPGMILRRNVLGGLERLQQKYPGVPMIATPPLGVDDRLVAVAADRVREVWGREDEGQKTKDECLS